MPMKIASMKNEKPSIAKPSPNTLPKVRGEGRPEQAHLEAEDRPGDDADGEQRHHHLRPAPRQRPVELIARAQIEPLDEQHQRRECDPEADERDVHRERQRLHLPRLQQVVLVHLGRRGAR